MHGSCLYEQGLCNRLFTEIYLSQLSCCVGANEQPSLLSILEPTMAQPDAHEHINFDAAGTGPVTMLVQGVSPAHCSWGAFERAHKFGCDPPTIEITCRNPYSLLQRIWITAQANDFVELQCTVTADIAKL